VTTERSPTAGSLPGGLVGGDAGRLAEIEPPGELGGSAVYLHVPFCRRRCDFCAFSVVTGRRELMGDYVAACRTELGRAVAAGLGPAATVYVGGGTPSQLPVDLLLELLAAVPRHPGAEVTVEANPEDLDEALLAAYRAGGVTRLSVGVQSTVPAVLGGLGRRAPQRPVAEVLAMVAAAGFPSWNVDLIIGGAGESDADWVATLDGLLGLTPPPPHVSAYCLTVEKGTVLAADPSRHPDDDAQARRYLAADRLLTDAGYRWEEISSWARPGHECRHHWRYWSGGDYLGVGCAAHSHCDGHRWWNIWSAERYVRAVASGRDPAAGHEHLTARQRAFERLALALRTRLGVPSTAFAGLEELGGFVTVDGDRAVLTPEGRLVANELAGRLVVPEPTAPVEDGRSVILPA
jgi:putative oxygen-independent coproporphyrinogen III oxidase